MHASDPEVRHAGLMFGPALLGLLADFTSVQTALCANAAVLAAVMGFFAFAVSGTNNKLNSETEKLLSRNCCLMPCWPPSPASSRSGMRQLFYSNLSDDC